MRIRSYYSASALLVTLLTAAEFFYVVVIATWILFEKRPPVSTLAWILALVGLPYVGFVVFFFLGPRRLVRKRLRHRRARGKARVGKDLDKRAGTAAMSRLEDPRFLQLERVAIGAGEPAADRCDEVQIFHDAATTYEAIETAIREAKHHIHVAYYIFDSGHAGTRLAGALAARAQEGVVVRVLVDDVGSSAIDKSMVEALRTSGVKFARFHPVTFSRIRSRIDFRNHRKIVVCDGVVGFTGGINICDDYVAPTEETLRKRRREKKRYRFGHTPPWRDTHLRLRGDAVRWLQLAFLDDWNYSTNFVPKEDEYFPPATGTGAHRVQIVSSGPDRSSEPIEKLYFAAIGLAQKRVLVTTPYFVPDDAILTALTTAALRGVDVRILVPRRSDSLVVTAAARSYYDDILAAGARVFEYEPTMIHAKTLVVDDLVSSVGTVNMDNRSFRLNFEITAILYGPEHADELARQFARDLEQSKEIDAAIRRQTTVGWRIGEVGARLLSPLL